MIDAVDSYWRHAVERMQTINPSRQMLGVMDAQDWPPKEVRFESFYLLVLGEPPLGRSFASAAIPVVSHELQWVWMILGTDLTRGKVGRGRGDRYRTDMEMKSELLNANFPMFAEKKEWSISGGSAAAIQLTGTPVTPSESIWWSPLVFTRRTDQESGSIYGAASVSLVDMTEQIAA